MKNQLKKSPTGIDGLDEITGGGLPAGRSTLICGGAGCGKTLLATEYLFKGITDYDEPGAFITFEETADELIENVASLGFDLQKWVKSNQLFINQIALESEDMVEIGKYDLSGFFTQIGYAIDSVGARRLVIDGIETLFSHFTHEATLRAEIKRLFRWLKEKGVTAIVTGEAGSRPGEITKHGIEQYLSDCVILLDQRIQDEIAIRRLYILKYRGTKHGTNEYPFLVTENGISVLPITTAGLDYKVPVERISSGIQEFDDMFGGKGYYKGSSILISGTAGTGKSSFAAHFAKSVCQNGSRCIYFAFEEASNQIIRNMQSIGLDLTPFVKKGTLRFHAARPTMYGLEAHLLSMHRLIDDFAPEAVIIDPISNLTAIGTLKDIKLMFLRILNHLKERQVTTLCTNLTSGGFEPEATEIEVSSIVDTWILLENLKKENHRQRSLSIVKSRGMEHSQQIRIFDITTDGIKIQQD